MFTIEASFFLPPGSELTEAGAALEAMRPFASWLAQQDLAFKHWYLGAETREEALEYEAFAEGQNGHDAALAVVRHEYKNTTEPVIFVWNGDDGAAGASLVLSVTNSGVPSTLKLALNGSAKTPRAPWHDHRLVAQAVQELARWLRPVVCTVYRPEAYYKHMTFKDRPGVGWMIYLPRALTAAQVPEAGDVIPVLADDAQIGTILVAVTDGVFSVGDPQHLARARAVEMRLVSQDWLPAWTGLVQA